jgi:hypothetical protein
MLFNTTINTISVISWQSVLLVEENEVTGENHRPAASHWQTLSHNVVSSTPRHKPDSNSQLYWWLALIAQIVVNPTAIRSWPHLLYIISSIWFCCFSTKHTASRRNSNDWLARIQVNVSEWGDMSICWLLFQWASTFFFIKIQLSVLV